MLVRRKKIQKVSYEKDYPGMKKYGKILGYVLFISIVIWYILQPLSGWKLAVPWAFTGIFFMLWRAPELIKTKMRKAKRYV